MSTPADDIIIKSGSVAIEFSEQGFPGQGGKHSNKDSRGTLSPCFASLFQQ